MLKGINKQIIEIRCNNNEHFEKALLFVRSSSCDIPRDELMRSAEDFTCGLTGERAPKSRLWMALPVLLGIAVVLLFVLLLT